MTSHTWVALGLGLGLGSGLGLGLGVGLGLGRGLGLGLARSSVTSRSVRVAARSSRSPYISPVSPLYLPCISAFELEMEQLAISMEREEWAG